VILVIREPATPEQLTQMRQEFGSVIKLAVDVQRAILAGGGALHSDCEQALLDDGSLPEDVWGADWYTDPALRTQIEATVRRLLEVG
jgi:hypothetical protein